MFKLATKRFGNKRFVYSKCKIPKSTQKWFLIKNTFELANTNHERNMLLSAIPEDVKLTRFEVIEFINKFLFLWRCDDVEKAFVTLNSRANLTIADKLFIVSKYSASKPYLFELMFIKYGRTYTMAELLNLVDFYTTIELDKAKQNQMKIKLVVMLE